jgi:hypothetical protein
MENVHQVTKRVEKNLYKRLSRLKALVVGTVLDPRKRQGLLHDFGDDALALLDHCDDRDAPSRAPAAAGAPAQGDRCASFLGLQLRGCERTSASGHRGSKTPCCPLLPFHIQNIFKGSETLDVQFGEDDRAWSTQNNSILVLGVLRMIAYNMLRHMRKSHVQVIRTTGKASPRPWADLAERIRDALRDLNKGLGPLAVVWSRIGTRDASSDWAQRQLSTP